MTLPVLVITGASGFVGRHLLAALKESYRIFGLARRSQRECGAAVHPNIAWIQVDIRQRDAVETAFREIASAGGARYLIHLAAHYDFTGEDRPEYRDTNAEGTRHVLDAAAALRLKRFIFASSVAACRFPRSEGPVSEGTPADADHPYARSKHAGEAMVRGYEHAPTCIVRVGAVYSDCCEYAPLYSLLDAWLGRGWTSRMLAGRGETAIPYVHVHEVTAFFRRLLIAEECLDHGEVLIACSPGCTSHRELYERAVRLYYGSPRKSVHVMVPLCAVWLALVGMRGRITGRRPFERLWMLRFIDRALTVDNSQTCRRLGWSHRPRYRIERRIAFMVERMKSEPFEWYAKNAAAMRRTTDRPDLRIYTAMAAVEDQVVAAATEAALSHARDGHAGATGTDRATLEWTFRLLYRLLMSSVQSANRMLLMNYMEVTAASRLKTGTTAGEICFLLETLRACIFRILGAGSGRKATRQELHDRITVPIEFGIDEIRAQEERYVEGLAPAAAAGREPTPREQLEETIWSCLVQRR